MILLNSAEEVYEKNLFLLYAFNVNSFYGTG